MCKPISGVLGLIVGVLAGFCAAPSPVRADDTEIFFAQTSSEAAPNIMFILDTSGSMDYVVQGSPEAYDPTKTYTGACTPASIYYRENGQNSTVPRCTGANAAPTIAADQMHCSAATTAFGSEAGSTGWFTDSAARWRATTSEQQTNCRWVQRRGRWLQRS